MKKKIISLCLVIALAATAIVGGTLAYFTDTDAATNTFTTGNVDIDLVENFEQDSKLMPGIDVAKEVWVENLGSEDAYVRVHIAIPQLLDDGADTFDASANLLHFNYGKDSIGEGKWDWSKAADDDKFEGNWNYYETTIDGVVYNVYVVTYTAALATGEKTVNAMNKVYMDIGVTNEDIVELNEALGTTWKILVIAEGGQIEGFENAYDALNTQFGVPGTYNPWAK